MNCWKKNIRVTGSKYAKKGEWHTSNSKWSWSPKSILRICRRVAKISACLSSYEEARMPRSIQGFSGISFRGFVLHRCPGFCCRTLGRTAYEGIYMGAVGPFLRAAAAGSSYFVWNVCWHVHLLFFDGLLTETVFWIIASCVCFLCFLVNADFCDLSIFWKYLTSIIGE